MSGLYDILGVTKSDSCTTIKKAYLKLARTHHPDKGGDPERFKEILRASEVLTDEKKRRIYDECGIIEGETPQHQGFNPFQGGFPQGGFPFEININDLFGNMFNSGSNGPLRKGKKPAATVQTINITLEQFYLGHNFDININRQSFCQTCNHTGAKSKEPCISCNGRGMICKMVQIGPMAMQTSGPCMDCQGKGERTIEKCDKCSGGYFQDKRTLSVKISPGTRPQETYIFPEVCSDHPSFERPGDVHIIIAEDGNDNGFKYFKRSGDRLQHLESTISLSLSESLIGCVVQIDGHPGYDEGLFVKIPAGSFHSNKYCLTGFGMPIPGNIGKYGDLFITIYVDISPMERTLFATKGRELLTPLFEDKIRTYKCPEESIQTELYLH